MTALSMSDDATYPNDAGYDELVIARDIPVQALCAEHSLPFTGVAHVGYLPDQRIVGLSKLVRAVDELSQGPQTQERITTALAAWLEAQLQPKGLGVVIDAEHTCMTLRGIQVPGSRTTTSSLRGLVRDDPRTRAEFLALTRAR